MNDLQGIEFRRYGQLQKASCPKHVDKTPSLVLYPDGHFHCFSCGFHGWKDRENFQKELIHRDRKPRIYKTLDWTPYREGWTAGLIDKFTKWRGYPERFVCKMIDQNVIGIFEQQFCFPVYQDDRIVRIHVRGEDKWFCYPSHGAPITPLMIGSRFPNESHLFESQWDMLAVASQIQPLYKKNLIATRGATNTAKLGSLTFPNLCYIWMQNDEAGERWLTAVQSHLPNRKVIVIRPQHKDPNESLLQGESLSELYERSK